MYKTIHFEFEPFVVCAKNKRESKKYRLNFNNYNNRKYFQYNKIKHQFNENLKEQMKGHMVKYIDKIDMVVCFGDKFSRDRDNYVAMIRKMFMDSLVNHGVIPDDTDQYVGPRTDYPATYVKGVYKVYINIEYID